MFEQAFRNIDDVLRKEAGCTTELDYTEQTSWLLFLKYLDGLEQDRAVEAELEGKKYAFILDKPYRWESWAAPKDADGHIDHNTALGGDDLRDFVNQKLFPYLHGFKQRASGPLTIEYKIGEIFGEIKNKVQSGYNLREIIDHIDELRFRSQTEKHELSHLYEAKIKNMGNAGRNGGEYYTPGASKWNPVEHKLFSQITATWAGVVLATVAIMVGLIRRTTTSTGLKVTARATPGAYPTGRKVTAAEFRAIRLTRHETCPQWNYTIRPRTGGENTE